MVEDFLKEIVLKSLIKASLRRLFLAIPILGWGPIGIIVTYFAQKYGELFFEEMKLLITIQKIKITNEAFEQAYSKASLKLRIYYEEYGADSPEYKRIENEAKESLADLIQFDIVT